MFAAKARIPSQLKAQPKLGQEKPFLKDPPSNRLWHQVATRIQPKLSISAPGDAYEPEADQIADRVMRMPGPTVQRSCAACAAKNTPCSKCEEEQKKEQPTIHRKVNDSGNRAVQAAPEGLLSGVGAPHSLDGTIRGFMEPRFGHDFSHVRIHFDAQAAESAKAVDARAYTVGRDIVFGASQYSPDTSAGRQLLAHELTHVVQQGCAQVRRNDSPAPGAYGAGELRPARASAGVVQRKATADDEAKKKEAVKQHQDQQENVAKLLAEGRKIVPDPSKGPLDNDNLFHNSVEMLDAGHLKVTIYSPTHDADTRKPPERAYFDSRVDYPAIGGDYPADPAVTSGDGLYFQKLGVEGEMFSLAITRVPGFMRLLTPPWLLDADELQQTFVHEAQHFADLHKPDFLQSSAMSEWQKKFEHYKTEFRAFWVQPAPVPPPPPQPTIGPGGLILAPPPTFMRIGGPMPPFSPATAKAKNQDKVTVADPQGCTICPAPAAKTPAPKKGTPPPPTTTSAVQTTLKNQRQEEIFWHLIKNYSEQRFDCFYVCSLDFRQAVDNFAFPESLNLINSNRLTDLYLALQSVNSSMTRTDEPIKYGLVGALMRLDKLDWQFLQDRKLSKPLWNEIDSRTPAVIRDGINAFIKLPGTPSSIDILGLLDETPSLLKDKSKKP